jgi:hypothetical protein
VAFNGSVKRKYRSHDWLALMAESEVVIRAWQDDHINHRLHKTFGIQPPA